MLNKTILFFVSEDWYFCSHRLPIARSAKQAGYDVIVTTRVTNHREIIEKEGFRLIPLKMVRHSYNLFSELRSLAEILRVFHSESPHIVHNVAAKPVIYGTIAVLFNKKIRIINALPGLGYVFSSKEIKARVIRPLMTFLYKILFRLSKSYNIVQNSSDMDFQINTLKVDKNRVFLIKGSGVNIEKFHYSSPQPSKIFVFSLVSRMLRDKGIYEFVEASRILKKKGINFTANLVGSSDNENPASISLEQLSEWNTEDIVNWLGHCDDIPKIWRNSHIAVLPSYREGLPMSLLEAAACGKPIITTDVPGCRDVVINGENGLLVDVRNPNSLANAMFDIITKGKEHIEKMGLKSRKLVENEFSMNIIMQKTLNLYNDVMKTSQL